MEKLLKSRIKRGRRVETKFLKNNIIGKKVLDVGCGTGTITADLYKIGYSPVGVDISRNFITLAKKSSNNKIKFYVADARNLPFKDKTFDTLICMWSTFCHFTSRKDQEKVIKEMLRVTKKRIIIDVSNRKTKKYKLVKGIFYYNVGKLKIPLRIFRKEDLKRLFKKLNIKKYKIIEYDFFKKSCKNRIIIIIDI